MNVKNDLLTNLNWDYTKSKEYNLKPDGDGKERVEKSNYSVNAFGEEGAVLSVSREGLERAKEGYAVAKVAAANATNQQYQAYLSALGFYSGSMDGNMTSQASRKAITNFQKVYGLNSSGSFDLNTRNKLENAYSKYNSVYTSNNFSTLNSTLNLDYSERVNFARTWAFLRVGMGLNSMQTSAIMGNINQESRFAPDNANNNYYAGDHNTGYSFKTKDGIAYGLVQWQESSRKQGLLNMANSMGISVADINAQFAYLRSEANGQFSAAWNATKNAGNIGNMTKTFMDRFEIVFDGSLETRKSYANAIHNALSSF